MAEFIQVSTAVDNRETANRVAKELVITRLAGCVQVFGPIQSSYWWNGKLAHGREWLCLIKSRMKNYRQVEDAIKKVHPYAVPEIIAVPVLRGSKEYLRWLRTEATPRAKKRRR